MHFKKTIAGDLSPTAGLFVRRKRWRPLGVGTALLILRATPSGAFPLVDPTNQDAVPTGTELATPDVQDLQHQLQLVNGLAAPPTGGWTIQPRIDAQAALTDNVFLQHSPRQWDLVTYLAPGLGIAADVPQLQLNFQLQPTLTMHVEAGSLNSLTQQYNGTGLATLVDDLIYVDFRALSAVTSLYGITGGVGSIGANSVATTTAATLNQGVGNTVGFNRNNEIQTNSFAISPYILKDFGDYGTAKLGYSFNATRSATLTGFASSPFPTGGNNEESLISNEGIAHYDTGDWMGRTKYTFDVDLLQTQNNTGSGFTQVATGLPSQTSFNQTTNREYISNTLSFVINQEIKVFGSGGYENIAYSPQAGAIPVHDLTWSIGTTLTPNPDSLLTVSYGHLNGYNSFTANGYYAITARTTLNVAYYTSVGTQLENFQSQLNLATGPKLVNGQTGGPLFTSNNAFGFQTGVFQTNTFTFGGQTVLDRDILSANMFLVTQTQQAIGSNTTSHSTAFTLQWIHELGPDLTLTTAGQYSILNQAAALNSLNPGNSTAVAASIALQYQITASLSSGLRYSFFDRRAEVAANSVYQNMLVFGISKTF